MREPMLVNQGEMSLPRRSMYWPFSLALYKIGLLAVLVFILKEVHILVSKDIDLRWNKRKTLGDFLSCVLHFADENTEARKDQGRLSHNANAQRLRNSETRMPISPALSMTAPSEGIFIRERMRCLSPREASLRDSSGCKVRSKPWTNKTSSCMIFLRIFRFLDYLFFLKPQSLSPR